MTFIVRALAVNPGVGTLELFAGDGLHVFRRWHTGTHVAAFSGSGKSERPVGGCCECRASPGCHAAGGCQSSGRTHDGGTHLLKMAKNSCVMRCI